MSTTEFETQKYPGLKALVEAFKFGDLKHGEYMLVVDYEESYLIYDGPIPEGIAGNSAEHDEFLEVKNDECYGWFDGPGALELAVEALGMIGIDAETF